VLCNIDMNQLRITTAVKIDNLSKKEQDEQIIQMEKILRFLHRLYRWYPVYVFKTSTYFTKHIFQHGRSDTTIIVFLSRKGKHGTHL